MSDDDKSKNFIRAGKLQIQIDDDIAQGRYSNFQAVGSNETEFVLDFAYVQPHQPRGRVSSRVILSPKHAKQLMRILQQRLADHESRFGPIPVPLPVTDPSAGGSGLPN